MAQLTKLRTKLQAATDPNEQARLRSRIDFRRRQTAPGLNSGMAANTPNKALTGLNNRMATVTDPLQKARMQERANYIANRAGLPRQQQTTAPNPITPAAPATPVANQPAPTPIAPQQQAANSATSSNSASATEALFPSMRAMEPSAYEGSPLYKFQADEGMKRLNRLMASRGLSNSGAEIEANSKFLQELGANEADKTRGYAQTEADRLERMQQSESTRLERTGNEQWNRYYNMLSLMANQNPMSYAYDGTTNAGNIISGIGKRKADYISGAYDRPSIGAGGGGGGGVSMPSFQAPYSSGPDYSMIDLMSVYGDQGSNFDLFNGINKAISYF